MNMKKGIALLTSIALLGVITLSGCGAKENVKTETANAEVNTEAKNTGVEGSIVALGSSAMQPLVDEAAKMFMKENSKAQIQVQGGGSGTGLSQVSSGGADIGNSDVFAEEKKGIDPEGLIDHQICVVGMGAVVNPETGVENVTEDQLIAIFTGQIKNWKEIGGNDLEITLVNRPKSSGTRATFLKYALNGNEEAEGITEESSGNVKKIVGQTPGTIGYLAFSYFDDSVVPLSIDGVEPKAENIYTGDYKVWAYEHSYTKGDPQGLAKAFLDYMMSSAVQDTIIPEMGYIPVSKMRVQRDVNGNITEK
ncbi:MAG: phosphate ABC transporter substrate-binding protein [Tissierellales bacterium]|jgi:phosphate transport system substrate-binding protein|nr:phosphate ABC transporter substrate-binding protein [Tissierellales bacterium]